VSAGRVEELEQLVEQLTAELAVEKTDRQKVSQEKENIKKEKDEVQIIILTFHFIS